MATPDLFLEPDPERIRQRWGTLVESEVGLDAERTERIVDAINTDLAGTFILFNQLRKHYWTAAGSGFDEIAGFLREAADRLKETSDELAIRIHALGGTPVCGPRSIQRHAPIRIEDENIYDARTSLGHDRDAYGDLVELVRGHVSLVDELGDPATAEILRRRLAELEGDLDAADKFLSDDTLVRLDAAE
jgi:DNA-binding ferritin-like protein